MTTMRDIAKSLGISHTTVSRALKNHKSIPESTKTLIRKKSEEMGYQYNPWMAKIHAQLRISKAKRCSAVLAFLTNYETPQPEAGGIFLPILPRCARAGSKIRLSNRAFLDAGGRYDRAKIESHSGESRD
jgi:DNA-binding LacI/PurR family transcriptional regulator